MQQKYKQQGFTIIEVMIVLAIAALIMLIVFLAVPALQRSSRNTAVKEDASRLATAVSTFVSNSNGMMPCTETGTVPNDAATIVQQAGTLSQLTFISADVSCSSTAPTSAPTSGSFIVYTASADLSGTWNSNAVGVYEGAKCSGSGVTTTGAQPRQIALLYPIEGGGGSYTSSCLQAQ